MTEPMTVSAEAVAPRPFEIPGSRGEFLIQILNEDAARGVVTSVIHIPAGGYIPAHRHEAGSEMHYVLSGDLIEKGEALGPGAFLTQAAGVLHGPHESQGGAQVLTVQSWQSRDGQFDFHIAEEEPGAGDGAGARGEPRDAAGAASPRDGEAAVPGAADPADRQAAERSLGRGYG